MDLTYDAVHGHLKMGGAAEANAFFTVTSRSPFMRMRRIRQLGFASRAYSMADHSRISHMFGSAHVAGELMRKTMLARRDFADDEVELSVMAKDHPRLGQFDSLAEGFLAHVRLAAACQDLGELPYESAIVGLYEPADSMLEGISDWLPDDFQTLSSKQIFTLAMLVDLASSMHDASLYDMRLVAALLYKKMRWFDHYGPLISVASNILDSPLDADRIDYVFRDALVTVGPLGSSSQVIDSLVRYDERSVLIDQPSHIAAFLMHRNHLYRSVYLHPLKRLHERALRLVMAEIGAKDSFDRLINVPKPGQINLAEFLELTDDRISATLEAISSHSHTRRSGGRLRQALETLNGEDSNGYEGVWVAPDSHAGPVVSLPSGVLVDARQDYARVGTIDLDFFRVNADQFVSEGTSPSISSWIPELSAAQSDPSPASILAFLPRKLDSRSADILTKARKQGSLYVSLREKLLSEELAVPSDTSRLKSFTGPTVTISWCWEDLKLVRRCVRVLYAAKIRYRLLLDPYDGLGVTPRKNSADLIRSAEVVLVLASPAYIRRSMDAPTGNISEELFAIHTRKATGPALPVLVVPLDEMTEVRTNFPWLAIDEREATYLGKSVADSNDEELKALMHEAMGHFRR